MKLNIIAYIVIVVLIVVILLQNNCSGPSVSIKETRDTVVVYIVVHDTINGKISPPKIIKDTVWLDSPENTPDTTYFGLLRQYQKLGNRLFEKKTYNTPFQIGDYGTITVNDTIKGNALIGSSIITDLNIPVTTITVEKEAPIKRQFYVGLSITGTKLSPIKGIYGEGLFKTKKDKLYGIGIGWNGEIAYKGSLYWPLKFK